MTPLRQSYGGWGHIEDRNGTKVLVKHVRRDKHFMRRNQSWGMALGMVQQLNEDAVAGIELHVDDDGIVLTVDMATFNRFSTIEQWRGYEEQAFLHEARWLRWPKH